MVSAIAGRLRRMGLADRRHRRHPIAQHRREHSDHARRAAGGHDRGAAAAVVAARRHDRRAGARRRQGADHLRPVSAASSQSRQLALRVAAEVFSIRYVCGFGKNLPDGIVPFDDLFDRRQARPRAAARSRAAAMPPPMSRPSPSMSAKDGLAAGRAQSSRIARAAASASCWKAAWRRTPIALSTLAPSSFAGMSLTLLPWLLTGGTLALHHPFDEEVFGAPAAGDRCRHADAAGTGGAAARRSRRVGRATARLPSSPPGVRPNGSP